MKKIKTESILATCAIICMMETHPVAEKTFLHLGTFLFSEVRRITFLFHTLSASQWSSAGQVVLKSI